MLVRLQFDRIVYDIIDVPKSIMEWYTEHETEFYERLYDWMRKQANKYYKNGCYYYARNEVIEWLNNDILKNDIEKVTIIALDKLDAADDNLPLMSF
jgi:hypothetical protein